MSIKTDITQEDYTAFVRYVARSASAISDRGQFVLVLIVMAVGFGLAFALSLMGLSSKPTIILAALSGLFVGISLSAAMLAILSRRQMRRMCPADDSHILGAQETLLAEAGIQQRSARSEALFQWSLVRAIAITEHHIFVMLDRIAGIILPMRAFSSDEEREQFVSEIEQRSGKVRSVTLPPNTSLTRSQQPPRLQIRG